MTTLQARRRWSSPRVPSSPILKANGPGKILGKAIPIRSARIRFWQGEKVHAEERLDVAPDADSADFNLALPGGLANVQTWFFDAAGETLCGAYHIDVLRKEP